MGDELALDLNNAGAGASRSHGADPCGYGVIGVIRVPAVAGL